MKYIYVSLIYIYTSLLSTHEHEWRETYIHRTLDVIIYEIYIRLFYLYIRLFYLYIRLFYLHTNTNGKTSLALSTCDRVAPLKMGPRHAALGS